MPNCLSWKTWAAALLVFVAGYGTARAAVIPVFVFAGQSNALARRANYSELVGGLSSWTSPQSNVLFAGPQGEGVSGTPTWQAIQPVNTSLSSFGPELSAGKAIAQGLNTTIGVTKYAVGSTYLANQSSANLTWDPNRSGGLYSQMLSRVQTSLTQLPIQQPGKTGQIAGFFWMQGENDAINAVDANAYQANLTALIARVRTDFNDPDLPFIFGQINVSNVPAYMANSVVIRQAQANVAALDPHAYLVGTDTFGRVQSDFVHFNTQGVIDLGLGFGNTYLAAVPEPGTLALIPLGLLLVAGIRCSTRRQRIAE